MSEDVKPTLTARERKFVEEYCVCLVGAEAARRAGYSQKNARTIAAQNLAKLSIKQAIEEFLTEEAMGRKEVLHRLARHARGSLEPFLYTGDYTPGEAPRLDLSTDEARANIDLARKSKTKTVTKIGEEEAFEIIEVEIELYDAQAALVHLGRAHKLFTDKQELTGAEGGPVQIVRVPAKRTQAEWELQAQQVSKKS